MLPICTEGSKTIVDASYNAGPVADIKVGNENLKDSSEYGYEFWLRFMTRHPTRLVNGKNAPWYFVARLTRNNPYGNISMGDRTLAIFLG